MNTIELLTAIQEDEKASDLFAEILISLLQNNVNLKDAVIDFLRNDVYFGINCSEYSDYYYSGQRISLTINGQSVAEDSFSIRKQY